MVHFDRVKGTLNVVLRVFVIPLLPVRLRVRDYKKHVVFDFSRHQKYDGKGVSLTNFFVKSVQAVLRQNVQLNLVVALYIILYILSLVLQIVWFLFSR